MPVEECSKVFISWRWGVGILVGMIITIMSLSAMVGAKAATLQSTVTTNTERIDKVETVLDSKMDKIIERLDRIAK